MRTVLGDEGSGPGPIAMLARAPHLPSQIDQPRIAAAVHEILLAIGENPEREGLRDTPARVARAYAEMFAGLHTDPAEALARTFEEEHDEFVLVKGIELHSVCEHHLLPFHGVAHVGYVPDGSGRITGLSKLARLVEAYATRPQVQERLTSQIADTLVAELEPAGVMVVIECEHMCMTVRGVRKPGSTTVTVATRGILKRDRTARQDALNRIFGAHPAL